MLLSAADMWMLKSNQLHIVDVGCHKKFQLINCWFRERKYYSLDSLMFCVDTYINTDLSKNNIFMFRTKTQ